MDILFHIRYAWQKCKYRNVKIGSNSKIALGTTINRPEKLSLGNNSYINGGTFSIGSNSSIIIGDNCLISYAVHLRTFSHNYENKDVLIRKQGEFEADIIVEDDVWIGYAAQIMPGIILHRGCVVGAGAVVTHDVLEYEVVGGVPARHIKYRI